MASLLSLLKKMNKLDFNLAKGIDAHKKGCNLAERRQDNDALIYFDIAIENGVNEAYEQRAYCLQALEFYLDAIEDLTRAIEYNPTNCNLYFCRGISKHTIGDFAGAIADKRFAIEYSKLKNETNDKRNEIAKKLGSNTVTEYYEIYMATWESDLEFDIQTRDRFSKIKESGLEKDIEYANQLLALHTKIWDINLKRRLPTQK